MSWERECVGVFSFPPFPPPPSGKNEISPFHERGEDENLRWKTKFHAKKKKERRKKKGGEREAAGEPIAKFEYSIRHNVLRKMMQLQNGVDLKSKSQVKKLVYVNRSSIVLPIGTAAIRPTHPHRPSMCHIWKYARANEKRRTRAKKKEEKKTKASGGIVYGRKFIINGEMAGERNIRSRRSLCSLHAALKEMLLDYDSQALENKQLLFNVVSYKNHVNIGILNNAISFYY